MMKRIAKIAAAVVMAVGITVLAVTVIYRSPTVAFAQVRQQILQAGTMAWTMTVTFDDPMAPEPRGPMTLKSRCMFKEPGLMRQVQEHKGKIINILTADFRQGRSMLLRPTQKRAQLIDLGDLPNSEALSGFGPGMNMVDELRDAIAGSEEVLGEKIIDGRQAIGFRVSKQTPAQDMEMDVWADAESGDILRVEYGSAGLEVVMSNFSFDEELDDSLFSVEPPEGYAMQRTKLPIDNLTEQDLVDGLRFLAEHNNNVFPEQPTISPEIVKNIGEEIKRAELSEEQAKARAVELQKKLMRLAVFINTKAAGSWHYAGDGVKLDDGQTPLCWYKPEGAELYRVIYGNLGVADVAEEDLPK